MADILPFKNNTPKKTGATKKSKSKSKTIAPTLCKSGFHKWKADKNTDFAVKEGKLLTCYRCERCGQTKTEWR